MTPQHKSNLAKTALTMLKSRVPLCMESFLDCPNTESEDFYKECGTTSCFLGFGPLAMNQKGRDMDVFEWWGFSFEYFGIIGEGHDWKFLFDCSWPDKKNQAAARALVVLRGETPCMWDWDDKFMPDKSVTETKGELKKWVINPPPQP